MIASNPGTANHGATTAESATRFFVRIRSDVLNDSRLSDGAMRLYGVLLDHSFSSDKARAPQAKLAKLLGRTRRCVQLYLRELVDAGHIEVHRVGRKNHYLLRTLVPRNGPQQAQSIAPIPAQQAQSIAPIPAQQAQKFAPPLLQDTRLSSNDGAAAAVSEQSTSEATEALVKVGMSPDDAEHYAGEDAALVLAVVAYFVVRRADPNSKPIKNAGGFLTSCLREPGRYGIARDAAGVWHPPRDATAAPARDEAGTARRAAEREQAARDRQEAGQNAAAIAALMKTRQGGHR